MLYTSILCGTLPFLGVKCTSIFCRSLPYICSTCDFKLSWCSVSTHSVQKVTLRFVACLMRQAYMCSHAVYLVIKQESTTDCFDKYSTVMEHHRPTFCDCSEEDPCPWKLHSTSVKWCTGIQPKRNAYRWPITKSTGVQTSWVPIRVDIMTRVSYCTLLPVLCGHLNCTFMSILVYMQPVNSTHSAGIWWLYRPVWVLSSAIIYSALMWVFIIDHLGHVHTTWEYCEAHEQYACVFVQGLCICGSVYWFM